MTLEIFKKNFLEEFDEEYDGYLQKMNTIKEVCSNYYGEKNVDVQIPCKDTIINYVYNEACFKSVYYDTHTKKIQRELLLFDEGGRIKNLSDDKVDSLLSLGSGIQGEIGRLLSYLHSTTIIYFPVITVKNELDNRVTINNVYIRFFNSYSNALFSSLKLVKTDYTYNMYICKYVHSHAASFSRGDGSIANWTSMCLGEGPLRHTVGKLTNQCLNISSIESLYTIFCTELNIWTKVESIDGGPYVCMSELGIDGHPDYHNLYINDKYSYFLGSSFKYPYDRSISSPYKDTVDIFKCFFNYLIRNKSFNYVIVNDKILFSDNIQTLAILFTQEFEKWIKEKEKELNNKDESIIIRYERIINNLFVKCVLLNGMLVVNSNRPSTDDAYGRTEDNNSPVLIFKGDVKYINIKSKNDDTPNNIFRILRITVVHFIINRYLKLINYEYRQNKSLSEEKSRVF